jgi:galactose oxidase-like protein/Kelch motif protein
VSRSLIAAAVLGLALAACGRSSPPDARLSAWAPGPDLPRAVRSAGVGALGLQIVVVGGLDAAGQVTAEVDAFDSAAATWARLADAPVAWRDANVAGVGDTLYLAGGLDAAGTAHGEAFALDAVTQRWRAIPGLPAGDERGAAGVIGAPDRIYLFGGVSSTGVLASCVLFDIAQQTLHALPALPAPRAHPAAMRRSDGWLIVAGGFADRDGSDPRDDVWGLPPLGTAWQPLAAMHLAGASDARGGCAYGVVLGQLTCAGGAGPGALVVESYDPYLDA